MKAVKLNDGAQFWRVKRQRCTSADRETQTSAESEVLPTLIQPQIHASQQP